MHTDLSPHLHTPNCNKLIEELKKCRIEHNLAQYFGSCNTIYSAMVGCLKQERIARSAANRAKSHERQAEFRSNINQN